MLPLFKSIAAFTLLGLSLVSAQTILRTVAPPDDAVLGKLAAETPYLTETLPNVSVPNPPDYGGETFMRDLEEVFSRQGKLKAEELWRANYDNTGFVEEMLNAENLSAKQKPMTLQAMYMMRHDISIAVAKAQLMFVRPRPYQMADNIYPAIIPEPLYAYPAGNPAVVISCLLTLEAAAGYELPKARAYVEVMCERRVTAGLETPSDVRAGQILGRDFFQAMFQASNKLQECLRLARKEW